MEFYLIFKQFKPDVRYQASKGGYYYVLEGDYDVSSNFFNQVLIKLINMFKFCSLCFSQFHEPAVHGGNQNCASLRFFVQSHIQCNETIVQIYDVFVENFVLPFPYLSP